MRSDSLRIRHIFLAVAERRPSERGELLDRECGDDRDLRRHVERLLAALDASAEPTPEELAPDAGSSPQPPDTIDSAPPASDAAQSAPDARHPGPTTAYYPALAAETLIADRYVLQHRIGEGGMGEVWAARQLRPVRRQVALKLIKAGMDSKAVLARFEQERQALALMDHPHIASVLDAGVTPTGQPFFAMELVQGQPLHKYCDSAKLTPKERLELFIPICQAVQHAHQKGIVHRDLKPTNILVTRIDGRAVPKVIDFGVAKATGAKLVEESLATQFGSVVGTLEYMSPEQAGFSGMDVDTRADIYSLGVILYELLTGLRPIDAERLKRAALTEMIRIIQEEEPSKPSTRLSTDAALPSLAALRQTEPRRLMAELRGELDWIVMKCLEKHRDRRYETANGLARDIQRYLAHEPIEARPPSVAYRFSKFLRRYRATVAAAAALLIILIAGVVGTTWGLLEARKQTGVAVQEAAAREQARRDEAAQRVLAEQANQQAYEALKSFTDELMVKVLGSRSELTDDERSILQSAQKQWEVYARSKGQSPQARVIQADGAENLALLQSRLGLVDEATANFRLALGLRSQLAAEFPQEARYRLVLAMSHQNLGGGLRSVGKRTEAEPQFQAAVDILTQLCAESSGDATYRSKLAESCISLGNSARDRGDLAAAISHYEQALRQQEALAAAHPEVLDYRWSEARSHWGLAFSHRRSKNWTVCEGHYRQAIAILEELQPQMPDTLELSENVASLYRELGVALSDSGNSDGSVAAFEKAVASQSALALRYPSVPNYRAMESRTRRDLGRALDDLKRFDEAAQQFTLAEAALDQLVRENPNVGPFQNDLGLTYQFHGDLEQNRGDFAASLPWYDRAVRVLTAAHERDPHVVLVQAMLAGSHANRAAALDALQNHTDAASNWDHAVRYALPDRQPTYRIGRAMCWIKTSRAPEAVAEVAELARTGDWSAHQWYGLACVYALASGAVAEQRQAYADRALELLRLATQAGFQDADKAAHDAALNSLRDREDFQSWLKSLSDPST